MSETPSIALYRGFLEKGSYVWSPFVTKAELHFRLNNIKYNVEAGTPLKGPTGKIPYISVDNGQGIYMVGDSTLIVNHLIELGIFTDLNAALSPEQKLADIGIQSLLEDKQYFYAEQEKFVEHYYVERDKILWSMPALLRPIIGLIVYGKTVLTLHGQGTGRFNREQIRKFEADIWESINASLQSSRAKSETDTTSKEPFWILGGAQPTDADATLFGFVTSCLVCQSCPYSQSVIKSHAAIIDYAERIHNRYFPDYEKWT